MKFFTSKTATRGFTLIELLVVIAIIGLLSSVVLASLNGARQRGRDTRRIADLKQLQVALELYYSSNNAYPIVTGPTGAVPAALATDGYIPVIPVDPGANTYYYAGTAQYYCLGATLETTTALPNPADSCTAPSGVTIAEPTGNFRVGP